MDGCSALSEGAGGSAPEGGACVLYADQSSAGGSGCVGCWAGSGLTGGEGLSIIEVLKDRCSFSF